MNILLDSNELCAAFCKMWISLTLLNHFYWIIWYHMWCFARFGTIYKIKTIWFERKKMYKWYQIAQKVFHIYTHNIISICNIFYLPISAYFSISYRNQSFNFTCRSKNWFLCEMRHWTEISNRFEKFKQENYSYYVDEALFVRNVLIHQINIAYKHEWRFVASDTHLLRRNQW